MAQTLRVETKGLRELGEKFKALAADMQRNAAKAAVRAGAAVVVKEAKGLAPEDTGDLKSAITAWRSRRDSNPPGVEYFRVGVRKVKRKYANTSRNRRMNRVGKKYGLEGAAFYWRFLEFGTVKMPARPFFRPAFDRSRSRAAQAIVDKLRERIAARK